MEVQANAKLNLTLDVLGRRPDGYHELCMVMQSVQLCDVLEIAPGEGRVSSNLGYLPTGEKNLAWAAARRFWEALGRPQPPLDIHIEKRIPVCAGMAGGSSDGAAVLRALGRLYPMPREALERIGAAVGSDVPYCVRGGTALAEGRGEGLTDLPALPMCHIVLCKPDFPISTPELFRPGEVTPGSLPAPSSAGEEELREEGLPVQPPEELLPPAPVTSCWACLLTP